VSRAAALLAAHTSGKTVRPGALLNVPIDNVVLDAPGAHAVATAWRRFGQGKPADFAARFVCVDGGRLPRKERPRVLAFAAQHGVALGLDPQAPGWPSTVAVEEGFIGSDDVVMADRAEVGALGGLGTLVVASDAPALAELMGRRTMSLPVPESLIVAVNGRLPRWMAAFDLAHFVLAEVGGASSVAGRVLQLQGDTVLDLDVDGRMALCRALAQAGVASIVPPDEATRVWLRARRTPEDGAGKRVAKASRSAIVEDSATAAPDVSLNARKVSFAVLDRPFPGTPVDVSASDFGSADDEGRVEQIVLAGQLSELKAAAEAMRDRALAPGIQLIVIPASRRVLLHAVEEGLAAIFVRAGATLLPPGAEPPPAPKAERRITTVPTGSADFLVSPVLAGSSAAMGRLLDPENMRRQLRRSASIR
jgi:homoaconitase/3-isopropylmalate dehydratase large subunit